MTTLKFADSHNMVAFLTKSAESEGFEQIVDFLNANPIKYALTVNPTIYTSCIEQFWSTIKAKMVNGEVQLQALVDGKKIVVTEASVRRDLQLEDAEGMDCLPNVTIFEELTRICAKTTAWNEFSSTMASAIICLATNQKFNFSKYIFESMVKNSDNEGKFLMYPRFVQVFLDNQLEGMATHDEIYIAPSHTKKGEGSAIPTDPQHTPTITQPSSSQPQKKHKPRKPKKKDTQIPQSSVPSDNLADEAVNEENVSKHSNDPLLSGEDRLKLEELMALCTNLQNRVLDLEHTKTTQALEIDSLKRRVKKLEKKQRSKTHGLKRLYKVGLSARVVSSEDKGLGEEDASKQGRKIHDINADEDITLENVHDEDITANPVTTVGEVVTTANVEVSTTSLTAATKTIDELTLAQTLAELKSARPKIKGVVMQEPSETTTTTTIPSKDKGKGITDKVETGYELAQRLQAEEQEELTIEEKSKLFQKLLEKRRKHFAAKRAKERRNKPPIKAQQRSIMCTYLKNMAGWKPKELKTNEVRAKGSETIAHESSLKRVGDELEKEKAKKQKIDNDQEEAKMKKLMEIIPDEKEVAVEAIPVATKPPSILLLLVEVKTAKVRITVAKQNLVLLSLEKGRYSISKVFDMVAAPVQTPPSPEWSLGSLPVSPSSPVVPSPIASPVATPTATISVDEDQFIEVGAQLELHGSILHDHTQRLDALPPTLVADIDKDARELYTRLGAVRDEIFSQRYRFRSLER
ncbi:hypothetical protein Tco_0565317 [Tanacetum coccineum]